MGLFIDFVSRHDGMGLCMICSDGRVVAHLNGPLISITW